MKRHELTRVEHQLPTSKYVHARGRNGKFVPKLLIVEPRFHDDGTPLLRISALSQRPSWDEPPLWFELPVAEWYRYAREVVAMLATRHPQAS